MDLNMTNNPYTDLIDGREIPMSPERRAELDATYRANGFKAPVDNTMGAEWKHNVEVSLKENINNYLSTHTTRELIRFIASQL